MNGKRFFIGVLAGIVLCFGVLVGLLSAVDPFFVLHGLEEGDTARFHNQRYQMAGLIRNQDYSTVVMGTSLVANYRASWFTQWLGEETLKITFPDGWISEFDTALQLAFRTHPKLDRVYFCLDPNILVRSDRDRTVELPRYLYNVNPLDDVEYLLNADTYQEAVRSYLRRGTEEMVALDDAYLWDTQYSFSKAWAIAGYPRPEVSETVLPAGAYLEAVDENLDRILGWAEEHPNVEFVLWYPPYSMLYWDKVTREGTKDAILTAVEYAAGRLLERENVTLHSFLFTPQVCDLDNYTDHIHCSGEVTATVARSVLSGSPCRLTREGIEDYFAQLREFVDAFDYEGLFE